MPGIAQNTPPAHTGPLSSFAAARWTHGTPAMASTALYSSGSHGCRVHPQRRRYPVRRLNPAMPPPVTHIPACGAALFQVAPKVQTECGKRTSKLPVEAVTVHVPRLSCMCVASLLLAGEFHDVPHNLLVERRKAVDGPWQKFRPDEDHRRWTTMGPKPGHESFPWIHSWTFPGIADPTACAERTEAVLNASNGLSEGCR